MRDRRIGQLWFGRVFEKTRGNAEIVDCVAELILGQTKNNVATERPECADSSWCLGHEPEGEVGSPNIRTRNQELRLVFPKLQFGLIKVLQGEVRRKGSLGETNGTDFRLEYEIP
jgi:hypothetical protein